MNSINLSLAIVIPAQAGTSIRLTERLTGACLRIKKKHLEIPACAGTTVRVIEGKLGLRRLFLTFKVKCIEVFAIRDIYVHRTNQPGKLARP